LSRAAYRSLQHKLRLNQMKHRALLSRKIRPPPQWFRQCSSRVLGLRVTLAKSNLIRTITWPILKNQPSTIPMEIKALCSLNPKLPGKVTNTSRPTHRSCRARNKYPNRAVTRTAKVTSIIPPTNRSYRPRNKYPNRATIPTGMIPLRTHSHRRVTRTRM
jgi:hypothetical protein